MNIDLAALPVPALIAISVTLVVQLTLIATSLIVLARTPRERLVFEKKWPWALIILLVNFVGAILFLAIGRRSELASEFTVTAPAVTSVQQTVQNLYGDEQQ